MAEFPSLPLWTDAYLADTTHLTTEQHGAYLLLLMKAWRRPDCALPDDSLLMSRMAGIEPRKWPGVWSVLKDFFLLHEDGLWRQKRLTKERVYVDAASERAKAAAQKRWGKDGNANADANASPPHKPPPSNGNAPTPTPTPTDSSLRSESPARKRKPAGDPEFEAWYAAYPKHEDRADAEKAYAKAIAAGAAHADLLAGAQRYAAKEKSKGTEAKYLKLPVTWLNKRCWLDDAPKASPGANRAALLAAWARHGIAWKAENGPAPTIAEQDAAKRSYLDHVVAFADNRAPWNADLYGSGKPDFGEVDRARAAQKPAELKAVVNG
jgi:uncharacterized protein YdaU (DUF1376 family)